MNNKQRTVEIITDNNGNVLDVVNLPDTCVYTTKIKRNDYNGWTNYATWRVNLEIIDGTKFVKEDITSSEDKLTIRDIADFLQDMVDDVISQDGELEGLAIDYARAFCNDVNYYEIAQHLVENNSALLE